MSDEVKCMHKDYVMDEGVYPKCRCGLSGVYLIDDILVENEILRAKISEAEKTISQQRHELALQAKHRAEDKHARQLLDKNACQRRVEELEKENAELNEAFLAEHQACVDALSKLDDAEDALEIANRKLECIKHSVEATMGVIKEAQK